ncbi:MAG: hypothetical protein KF886_14150 [Candidatus Hydrogenedentes bacterium]|nr:hypothetical protein [Candidatus Hydrogenedentota bacterium]
MMWLERVPAFSFRFQRGVGRVFFGLPDVFIGNFSENFRKKFSPPQSKNHYQPTKTADYARNPGRRPLFQFDKPENSGKKLAHPVGRHIGNDDGK